MLNKDFPFSSYALEVKTKTPSNVVFKVAGTRTSSTAPITGDIETKYTDKKHGLVFTQTWTTANALKSQLEIENTIANGLKLDITTSLLPEQTKSNKSAFGAGVVNAIYKQSGFHTRTALDLLKGPTFTLDTVVGRDGFLVGAEGSYNVTDGKITGYAAAVGYNAPDYAVTLHALNKFNRFTAAYYHRVSADVEAGAKAVYDHQATHGGMALEVGTKVFLDNAASVKAKINNSGTIALGYTQVLRPGVKATIGIALDTQKLNSSAPEISGTSHKVGASFVFES